MRAFLVLIGSFVVGVLLAMAMALYLPLEQVNRMFLTGLGAPLIISLLSVMTLRIERFKPVLISYLAATPLLLFLVYRGIT
ncbi:MAG: hypothetical protein OXE99_05120 [Cellvibrionales bacterium]|nr:hypothetical protein [Cellvibrionales bacterium]